MNLEDIKKTLPVACIHACICAENSYEACAQWVENLDIHIFREECIRILVSHGNWTFEELEGQTDVELNIHLLWLCLGTES